MLITRLEELDKKKIKVYIDYEYSFLLYPPDIKKYKLEEEKVISEELYSEIIEETVYRRAKQKALSILKFTDRTESELAAKLRTAYYTEKIITETLEYVKSYHYIDDERYAVNYIQSRKGMKSKRQIQMELLKKGLEKSLIEKVLEDTFDSDEEALKRAIRKKTENIENLTAEQKQKLFASLYRKGFHYDDIIRYL